MADAKESSLSGPVLSTKDVTVCSPALEADAKESSIPGPVPSIKDVANCSPAFEADAKAFRLELQKKVTELNAQTELERLINQLKPIIRAKMSCWAWPPYGPIFIHHQDDLGVNRYSVHPSSKKLWAGLQGYCKVAGFALTYTESGHLELDLQID